MSKFQTVFASGIFLLSTACTPQVQPTIPVATPIVLATPSPAPVVLPVTVTVTTKVKNPYPPEAIANYLDVCGKSGNSKAYCDCSIAKAQDLYPLNEFSEAYALAASGKKSVKMDEIVNACKLKKKEQQTQPSSHPEKEILGANTLGDCQKRGFSAFADISGRLPEGKAAVDITEACVSDPSRFKRVQVKDLPPVADIRKVDVPVDDVTVMHMEVDCRRKVSRVVGASRNSVDIDIPNVTTPTHWEPSGIANIQCSR